MKKSFQKVRIRRLGEIFIPAAAFKPLQTQRSSDIIASSVMPMERYCQKFYEKTGQPMKPQRPQRETLWPRKDLKGTFLSKRTTGYVEKVGEEQSHYLRESCKERDRMKSNQVFTCQSSVKEWGYCYFKGLIAGSGKGLRI